MSPLAGALWGLAGALVVEALELAAQIRRNKGRFPWVGRKLWPSLLAVGLRLAASGMLAAAMSDQFIGRWPAFCVGAAAPIVVSRVMEYVPSLTPGNGAGR